MPVPYGHPLFGLAGVGEHCVVGQLPVIAKILERFLTRKRERGVVKTAT